MFISIKYHGVEYSRSVLSGNYLKVSSSAVNIKVLKAVHSFLQMRHPNRHFELAEIIIKSTASRVHPQKVKEETNAIAFI